MTSPTLNWQWDGADPVLSAQWSAESTSALEPDPVNAQAAPDSVAITQTHMLAVADAGATAAPDAVLLGGLPLLGRVKNPHTISATVRLDTRSD